MYFATDVTNDLFAIYFLALMIVQYMFVSQMFSAILDQAYSSVEYLQVKSTNEQPPPPPPPPATEDAEEAVPTEAPRRAGGDAPNGEAGETGEEAVSAGKGEVGTNSAAPRARKSPLSAPPFSSDSTLSERSGERARSGDVISRGARRAALAPGPSALAAAG